MNDPKTLEYNEKNIKNENEKNIKPIIALEIHGFSC